MSNAVVNRGTGAGGATTNKNGLAFEEKTDNTSRLLGLGFTRVKLNSSKYGWYLEKKINAQTTAYFMQKNGLNLFCQKTLNKELCREPDEAYVFLKNGIYSFFILEKKNQNTPGSVDQKLMLDQAMIRQYKFCLGSTVDIQYAYCISAYLKKEYVSDTLKYRSLRAMHQEDKTPVFFGDDTDYFERLDAWLGLKDI